MPRREKERERKGKVARTWMERNGLESQVSQGQVALKDLGMWAEWDFIMYIPEDLESNTFKGEERGPLFHLCCGLSFYFLLFLCIPRDSCIPVSV